MRLEHLYEIPPGSMRYYRIYRFAFPLLFHVHIGGIVLWGKLFFIFKDKKLMEENGFVSPSVWWFLIPVVYLWKRATILKTKRTLFFMYFLVCILASIIGGILNAFLVALSQNL